MNTSEEKRDWARIFKHKEYGQVLVTVEYRDEESHNDEDHQLTVRFPFNGLDASLNIYPLTEQMAFDKLMELNDDDMNKWIDIQMEAFI